MTINDLKEKGLIIYEVVAGSHAYGLNTPESDLDIKGVFVLPKDDFYGLGTLDQVNDATNDTVYYELKRFMELLAKNNPNILEMLYSPGDCVRVMHRCFEVVRAQNFLSKLCEKSFGGYAMTQVKKARGLNKKILNPILKERKGVLDFCYVAYKQTAVTLKEFLQMKGWKQEDCGVSNIAHMPDVFGLYYGPGQFNGLMNKSMANELTLSSIPKGQQPDAYMTFNKSAYSSYCKEYKAYWEWTEKRNEKRYENTLSNGKNYDSKNMMHTIRLLNMAEEIATTGQLLIRRPDREYLLKVKKGEFSYEQLLAVADEKTTAIRQAYLQSDLPNEPDQQLINRLLIVVRECFYTQDLY